MNGAPFDFTLSQLVVFRQLVTKVAWDHPQRVGILELKRFLDDVEPGQPFRLEPGQIVAADEAFALSPDTGLPEGLDPDGQEDYRHVKALVAAAAVD